LRPKVPANLTMYEDNAAEQVQEVTGFIPSKPSLRTRLEHWISGYQS
jgi:hypothetical protein